jgi:hypothetical protein
MRFHTFRSWSWIISPSLTFRLSVAPWKSSMSLARCAAISSWNACIFSGIVWTPGEQERENQLKETYIFSKREVTNESTILDVPWKTFSSFCFLTRILFWICEPSLPSSWLTAWPEMISSSSSIVGLSSRSSSPVESRLEAEGPLPEKGTRASDDPPAPPPLFPPPPHPLFRDLVEPGGRPFAYIIIREGSRFLFVVNS